jgi:hypothetical protein
MKSRRRRMAAGTGEVGGAITSGRNVLAEGWLLRFKVFFVLFTYTYHISV